MKYKQFFLVALVMMSFQALSQEDVKAIIPATPTTAALGKYGEVPVSYHTGLPNISVPIAQLSGKDLSLPISLTYHAGGIKVEEMASWVGLGWSLQAGGVITREVRGLADESTSGFFNKADLNADFNDDSEGNIFAYAAGTIEFEPDVFYFNMNGESGQFIYNEVSESFVTVGKSNKTITRLVAENGWQIVSEDGMRYIFNDRETNTGGSTCGDASNTSVVTGWYLSRIVNPNKTDSIMFNYDSYAYSYQTLLSTEKKFIPFGANEGCTSIGLSNAGSSINCYRNNEFLAVRLQSITARSGKVVLVPSDTQRTDLPGDYALDSIRVYDNNNALLYSYKLNHEYFLPMMSGSAATRYRLKLLSIDRISGTVSENYRDFEYTTTVTADRHSFGQDFWGYYNGKEDNPNLVPTMAVETVLGYVLLRNADRTPSSTVGHAQMGMLSKVIYPTGGYTLFEYENHEVENPWTLPTRIHEENLYPHEGTGPVRSMTFTILVGPSHVNGFNPDGGAFVSIDVGGINCDYGQTDGIAKTGCAVIGFTGPVGHTLTKNLNDVYLPNGTYTFTLDFTTNSDPSSWAEFYARVFWKELDDEQPKIAGGLRIKKISDFDPLTNQIARQRHFRYYTENDTTQSSAEFRALPSFARFMWYRSDHDCPPGPVQCTLTDYCQFLKLSAISNYPVPGSNGSVTYGFVTVLEKANGTKGKVTFEYTNDPDSVNRFYPFVPVDKNDWRRGMLLEQKEYGFKNDSFELQREILNMYTFKKPDSLIHGIRISSFNFGDEIVTMGELAIPIHFYLAPVDYYLETSFRVNLDSTITRNYDTETPANYTELVEINTYNSDDLNVRKKEVLFENYSLINRFKYAGDYEDGDDNSEAVAIGLLESKNMIRTLIEQSSWKKRSPTDSVLVSSGLQLYKGFSGKVFKNRILSLPTSASYSESVITDGDFLYSQGYEDELEITEWDAVGNILEATGKDGIQLGFTWDAAKLNVIAMVKGSTKDNFFHTSFEDEVSDISSTAFTGSKSRSTSFTVNVPGGGTKKLTYWKKNGSDPWEFVTTTISTPTVIGGSGLLIDEVRVYPAGAQITTYTHKPGIGIRTINDPNNKITSYDYDPFGRLNSIRDHEGKLLQTYQYHLKEQP